MFPFNHCALSPGYSMNENSVAECNNWNRRSKTYLSETQYHPYSALSQTSNAFMKSSVLEYSFEEVMYYYYYFKFYSILFQEDLQVRYEFK